jgi:hypothetical protein
MLIITPPKHPLVPKFNLGTKDSEPNDINHLQHHPLHRIRIPHKIRTKKNVQNRQKSHQKQSKSSKIVQNHIKIVRYSLLFSSINKPLPILECGGKRSATPLWMPQRPMMKQMK